MQKHFSKEIWRVKCREGFQKETFQKGYGDVIASFLGKFLETNCKGSCMLAMSPGRVILTKRLLAKLNRFKEVASNGK